MDLFFDAGVSIHLPTMTFMMLWFAFGLTLSLITIVSARNDGKAVAPTRRLIPTVIILSVIWPYLLADMVLDYLKCGR